MKVVCSFRMPICNFPITYDFPRDYSLVHCKEWAMFILNEWLLNIFFIHCIASGLFSACCVLNTENITSERKYPNMHTKSNALPPITEVTLSSFSWSCSGKGQSLYCWEPILKCLIILLQDCSFEYIWYYMKQGLLIDLICSLRACSSSSSLQEMRSTDLSFSPTDAPS